MFWDNSSISQTATQSITQFSSLVSDEEFAEICPMDGSFSEKDTGFLSPDPKHSQDLSLYGSNSPDAMSCDGSPRSTFSSRRPLEDLDSNTRDSGWSSANGGSPKQTLSFGSSSSMEETFLDLYELEENNENVNLPGDFNKLITGSLINKCSKVPSMVQPVRPIFKKSLSVDAGASKVRSCLFKENEEVRNFKRPEPPSTNCSPGNSKRSRANSNKNDIVLIPAKTIYKRSVSENLKEENIKIALHRSFTEPDLIGDFSKAFCLPLIPGKHQDLKSISSETLAALMRGEFNDHVATFKVIDCRYPYEFEGGHISGAENLYNKQQILDKLLNTSHENQPESHKRNILVFHCEFSSERGPNLSRFLRNVDRSHNKDTYPFLRYPEVYLLDGGYKKFFEDFSELCAPNGYLPMLHPDHEQNLRHFRSKSKTWNSDTRTKSKIFKRL